MTQNWVGPFLGVDPLSSKPTRRLALLTRVPGLHQRLPASVRAEWHPISASDQYVLQGGVAAGSATVTGIFDRLRPQARRDDGQPMMLQLDIPERYAVLAAPSPAPAP